MNLQQATSSSSSEQQQHTTCNRCFRTYASASALAKHLIRPSQCYRPRYVCVKCKNPYASMQSLTNHKRKCNGPANNICDGCERVFSTPQALTQHKRRKCNLSDQKQSTVSAAGIMMKQAAAGSDASINSILDSIVSTKEKVNPSSPLDERQEQQRDDEENTVIAIIQKLDDVYGTAFKQLLKALKGSNVENNELILPKILDKLKTLPDEDRIELEHFVRRIDEVRVEELVKAVFAYVTRHDQDELKQIIEQIKKSGNDVSHLNELLQMFFEKTRDENGKLLLPQIEHIIVNLPILKTDQLRFQILLRDLEKNRYRIERILTSLNSASTGNEYLDRLHHLTAERFLSNEQFNQLNSSLNTSGNRDISHVANIIKMSKIGRGVRFLPRTTRGLYDTLNMIVDDSSRPPPPPPTTTTDSSLSSNNSSTLDTKELLLAILDELLQRKAIPEKDYIVISEML